MGGVTVLRNAWGVTMDHSGLYSPWVVLQSYVMHGVLPWIIVVSIAYTNERWCYSFGMLPSLARSYRWIDKCL